MNFSFIRYIFFFAVIFLLTSCQHDEAMEEYSQVTVPVRLSVPVEHGAERVSGMQRVMGDPGYAESLAAPQYVYIFAVIDYTDGTQTVFTNTEQETDATKWTMSTYSGNLQYEGDDILTYTKDISIPLTSKKRSAGRIYAAMSPVPLALSNSAPTTEADVLNITYTVDQALQPYLQNIYSTPYNYSVEGAYYGTLANITEKIPTTRLLLYHVASKVDVMWAVPEELRSQMKITGVTAKNLYTGQAYLFKPNEQRSEIISNSNSVTLASNTPATWWEGRQYIYTIPYLTSENKFPLQIGYNIQTSIADTYDLTLLKAMPSEQVFAPWMRCQMTFTEPKSGTDTKIIE
ncbi:MAG TPA: hypothetical protein DEO38_01400 [Bacteroidales bacterium]|jgi:hypothetical protein|nr:hypothetical protein [Bacteroidales bacterium]